MDTDILIAGGGASGLTAAIKAADSGKKVFLLEHKDRIGKKILATGNGKCNFTNHVQDAACYHCTNETFPMEVLSQFGKEETLSFFDDLGIYPKDKNGYLYPNSLQASSVLDVLKLEIEHKNVMVSCHEHVRKMKYKDSCFYVTTDRDTHRARKVILCTGGMAASRFGSDGSGYALAKTFGHSVIEPVPALAGLKAAESYFKALAGVRVEGTVFLYRDGLLAGKETGEVQFTAYGLSGIPVFQICRTAANALKEGAKVDACLDVMPGLTETELAKVLKGRCLGYKTAEKMLIGLLPKKLIQVLLKMISLKADLPSNKITGAMIKNLSGVMKRMKASITGTNGFENAQATAGGIDTVQINSQTMESKLKRGLYFAGEILDVDGKCGGYNLQWAWSTGAIAGIHAGIACVDESQ